MSALATGSEFAGYRIDGLAGRGAMGVVYRATQLRLGRVVALKVLAADYAADAVSRARFEHESQIAAQLEHPHVVPVYDVVEQDGRLGIAMRYIDGDELAYVLSQRGVLEPAHAVSIINQVAGALDAAHARGLIHRDVKPANVLLVGPPGREHAYLTDFGIAKPVALDAGLTQTGGFVGTVDYVAPEQVRGKALDARTDVYSLGCVLVELLSGEVPYPRGSATERLFAHLYAPPPDLAARAPHLSEAFAAVVRKALAKDPDDRYASAGELGSAAVAAAEGQSGSAGGRTVTGGTQFPKRPADAATVVGESAGAGRTRLRTVVVTDVVGSTELVAHLGDRESERLFLSHFDDLKREVHRARGTVVKTLGDGVMALFEAAGDATACAVAMQRAVSRKPVHGRRLYMRVGISSGDVRLQDRDCHGVAVVEACRLCDHATGGQILVAESARLLARGSPATYRRIGELSLKGLAEPVGASELEWAAEPEAKLRVLVADDAVLLRQGLAHVLEERGFDVVGQAGDGEELVRLALELRPDVAVVDVHMPPTYTSEGLNAAERIRAELPDIGLLVLSQDVDEHSARRLLSVGRFGLGYALKERVTNVGEFADAVRTVAAGGTAFEAAVLAWLFGGDAAVGGIRELTDDELDALQAAQQAARGGASATRTRLED